MKGLESRISQPKVWSWIETVAGTVIGLAINVYAQHVVFPYFGIHIHWSANFGIAAIFTVISIIRGYVLRRVFNYIHVNIDKLTKRVYHCRGVFRAPFQLGRLKWASGITVATAVGLTSTWRISRSIGNAFARLPHCADLSAPKPWLGR